ncbi:MAG: hypothetical protein M1833_001961 [Piccolia ochrophora]|nr:MAG: hypothetical protein M1833_001961 [Piccolia ochrophora]
MSGGDDIGGCSLSDSIKYAVIAAFSTATIWNAAELLGLTFVTFKRRSGLYFWSLIVAAVGTGLDSFAFILKFYVYAVPWPAYSTLIMLGFWGMVTGQSMVLWSRLHLVVRDQFLLRAVLAMIIVDAICLHIPTSVITWGYYSPRQADFATKYWKVENVQMTVFCVQEIIIALLYVRGTLRLLNPTQKSRHRRVLFHLLLVNVLAICMDAVLLGMQFSGYYEIQAALKPLVYSIKLKLEFIVLNQIMVLSNVKMDNDTGAPQTEDGTHEMTRFGTQSKAREPRDQVAKKKTWLASEGIENDDKDFDRPVTEPETGTDSKHRKPMSSMARLENRIVKHWTVETTNEKRAGGPAAAEEAYSAGTVPASGPAAPVNHSEAIPQGLVSQPPPAAMMSRGLAPSNTLHGSRPTEGHRRFANFSRVWSKF